MGSNSISAQFVALLIEEYKALPSLWQNDCDAYKNKYIKRKDYETLLHLMLPVDPLLTMSDLKKKLANIRTCYRREVKKVENSIALGATGDNVYFPTLWYFKQMEFLRDQEQRSLSATASATTTTTVDQNEEEHRPIRRNFKTKPKRPNPYKSEIVSVNKCSESNKPYQKLEIVEIQKQPEDVFNHNRHSKTNAHQNHRNEKDEANTFSETWALLFRKLSPEQQLFGKRCIDEVLYQGQLGNLTCDTHRSIEGCLRCSSDSESSTTNPGNIVDTKLNTTSTCTNNYDMASKDMSSFLHELCRNQPGT